MQEILVADEMGLGMTLTTVAVAKICKLPTEKVLKVLPLLILLVNAFEQVVKMVQNDNPGMISDEWEWYPMLILNTVPHLHLEIPETPPLRNPAVTSAL